MKKFLLLGFILLGLALSDPSNALAAENISTVEKGGVRSLLIVPKNPIASVILLAGGDGALGIGADGSIQKEGNQLVRTRMSYSEHHFAVLVPDAGYKLADLVKFMRTIKSPVVVVATSRGTQRVARGINEGAKPDKLVLTSGFLSAESGASDNVISIVRDPALIPPVLIVHHRQDHCRMTKPEGVEPFMKWVGKKAKLVWLDGGRDSGDACEAESYHGFLGIDQQVVDVVSAFVN